MEQVTYCFETSGHYIDAATLRSKTGLPKSTLHRKLSAIERDYATIEYGNRKLYSVRILEAFAPAAITMPPQKDNATHTAKNEDHD